MTTWSPQQERALDAVGRWLRDPHGEQVFRLFGFAGTGKTTLAKHLAESAGRTLFAAYTGKAAHVLRQKGCAGAATIHSLLYLPSGGGDVSEIRRVESEIEHVTAYRASLGPTPDRQQLADATDSISMLERQLDDLRAKARRPYFTPNPESPIKDADLLVIDECSMVGGEMADDLLRTGVKILVLGDPAQLPPVGSEGYFTNATPDVLLTEVHRQARESGILQAATIVRETGRLPNDVYGAGGDCVVVDVRTYDRDALRRRVLDADQVLVGKNATRHAQNQRIRELRGHASKFPEAGDKLVCLRNDHRVGLLNGSLWRTHEVLVDESMMQACLTISGEDEGAPKGVQVTAHLHPFVGREKELVGWTRREAQEFDFGDALTVHKSQGSQWGDVVLFDESGVFRQDARRWLYTGITRAANRLLVVRC